MEYEFLIDLLEGETGADGEEQKQGAASGSQAQRNLFYLNMEDFSSFKFRSAVFLIDFPLTATLFIIRVWQKHLPEYKNIEDSFSEEEIEKIVEVRKAIRVFCTNLVNHIQNLIDYILQIKASE